MKNRMLFFMLLCSVVFLVSVGVAFAGKSTSSHDWKQEAQNKNPKLAEKVASLADRLVAMEAALDKEKANGSRVANNLRGGIVNLRISMESLYEPLGGREVLKKRVDSAYKGVASRQRMVENMFKRADFKDANAMLDKFKEVLSDLESLRPEIDKAIQ